MNIIERIEVVESAFKNCENQIATKQTEIENLHREMYRLEGEHRVLQEILQAIQPPVEETIPEQVPSDFPTEETFPEEVVEVKRPQKKTPK